MIDEEKPNACEIIMEEITITFDRDTANAFDNIVGHLISCGYDKELIAYISEIIKIEKENV
jgi:hypothetical protein